MIECLHLEGSKCLKFDGPTTESFCQRCHFRQPKGLRAIVDYLPLEAIERIVQPVNQEITIPSGTPFMDRRRVPLDLRTLYAGCTLFLVLSGPSFRTVDQSLLNRRGVITMGINNSAATWRPHLWTHVDPPHKFHSGIWLDPGIIKLMPERFFTDSLRIKEGEEFTHREESYKDLPGVIGYTRNASFNPEVYLSEPTINFGNSSRWNERKKKGNPRRDMHPHVINVMLAALKIPYSLGFRRVCLLGADFNMPASGDIYSFISEKDESARISNNKAYLKLNLMFGELKKTFEDADYQIFNCTKDSDLISFPFKDLEEAIDDATTGIPQETFDTRHWYIGAERKRN